MLALVLEVVPKPGHPACIPLQERGLIRMIWGRFGQNRSSQSPPDLGCEETIVIVNFLALFEFLDKFPCFLFVHYLHCPPLYQLCRAY